MVFRFPVKSSESEVQLTSPQNAKVEKVSDFGHLVAKTRQRFRNESHEKFTQFQTLSLCHHYLINEQFIFISMRSSSFSQSD